MRQNNTDFETKMNTGSSLKATKRIKKSFINFGATEQRYLFYLSLKYQSTHSERNVFRK